MDIEKYIEKLRKEKETPGTPAFLIYKTIENAHPTVREVVEYQAANILKMSESLADSLSQALETPEGKKQFREIIQRVVTTNNKPLDDLNEESNDS